MTVESVAGEIVIGTAWGKNLIRTAREEAREELLAELLGDRFGPRPDIPAIVHRLMTWPVGSAVRAVNTASSLDELVNAQPPSA